MMVCQFVVPFILYFASNGFCFNRIRANQTAHVKTSLVHTLHRIQKYGSYDLSYYLPLLTEDQIQSCKNRGPKLPWYPLTQDLMVSFIFNVRS